MTAYVSHNHVQATEVPDALASTFRALVEVTRVDKIDEGPPKPTPKQIEQSITPDHLISFEDGKPYKTLRRHLALFGMTPDDYRAKWGLGPDYPMTAPSYSARRSALARALGLGLRHRPTYAPPAAGTVRKPRGRSSGGS